MSSAAARSVVDDLEALRSLLRVVAGGEPPTRENAVVYANCRTRLVASPQGNMLPGFLYQCGTIDRFREFIHLYDPDVELRRKFIDRMIDRAHPADDVVTPRTVRKRAPSSAWDF